MPGKPRSVRLAAVATATPPFLADQRQAEDFLTQHFAHRLRARSLELMRKFLAHPSVRERRFALESPDCLLHEGPDGRIARFLKWAVELSAQSSLDALAKAGLRPQDISVLVVNTCTCYLCPGLTSYLMERLGLPQDIRAYDLVGSGCGGAVLNLQAGADSLKANGEGAALCVSVEISSATFQMEDDLSLILSNTLFADAAAAAVLWTRPHGLELWGASNCHQPEDRDAIRYIHKKGELYNQLSPALPKFASRAVAEAVHRLLTTQGLAVGDISHWALHGGGHKVINAVGEELGLPESKLRPTREILARYGNMSSPSVLFPLSEILNNGIGPQEWCVVASFGAGLSAHALLLRST
ncbi:MAG TPA: 3-oxoacyl-[acyl-carrier-protein] synthase III C-terminal domain-containing protein [Desulfobaccales bacterium]|nr:3-oxoacyl-[acyl-carrier-protein] synthase III C-terminal domain-containing protein [Desulfobaccales bacterium]